MRNEYIERIANHERGEKWSRHTANDGTPLTPEIVTTP